METGRLLKKSWAEQLKGVMLCVNSSDPGWNRTPLVVVESHISSLSDKPYLVWPNPTLVRTLRSFKSSEAKGKNCYTKSGQWLMAADTEVDGLWLLRSIYHCTKKEPATNKTRSGHPVWNTAFLGTEATRTAEHTGVMNYWSKCGIWGIEIKGSFVFSKK